MKVATGLSPRFALTARALRVAAHSREVLPNLVKSQLQRDLYADSDDVRWLYLDCRCPACGLTGVYGDWKNEFNGFEALLDKVETGSDGPVPRLPGGDSSFSLDSVR